MKKWPWFLLTFLLILLDQWSKQWALITLIPYQPISIFSVLNLTLAYNAGVAFSFFNGPGLWQRWFFTGFSVVMSVLLSIWIIRSAVLERLQLLALSLILSGAIGNLLDRIKYGYVIDFIDFYYKRYHWPVFNIADMAICIGAFLLLISHLYQKNTRPH